jgi:hypothetical protein
VTVEERVARILAELGEEVRPLPDPYGRVRAGRRRQRRRRVIGLGLVLVTLLSVTGVALTGGPGGRHDETADPERDPGWARVVEWTWRMMDSPPRGAVAADRGYDTTLANLVLQRQRRGEIGQVGTEFTSARTLFVDDVGSHRIGLVALVRADPQPNFWPHASIWLVARKGASAAELAATAASGVGDALEPYMEWAGAATASDQHVFVGLAPAGCEFKTATGPDEKDWKPEPTGSYILRTEDTARREWWQLTCEGVVREIRPVPAILAGDPITSAELAAATSSARRGPEPAAWRETIMGVAAGYGYALAEVPRAVWAGRVSWPKPGGNGAFSGEAQVVAARAAGGDAWQGEVRVGWDEEVAAGSLGTGFGFAVDYDPTDPSTLLVIPVDTHDPPERVLLITPEQAVRVTAVRDGREIGAAPVVDGAAVLAVPATGDVEFRAIDAAGGIPATAHVAGTSVRLPTGAGWDR